MQIRSSGQASQLIFGPTQGAGKFQGVTADALRVACGFVVAEVDRRAEGLQRVFITALDLVQSFAELDGAGGNHFFEMLAVVFDLPFEAALMKGALQAGQDGVFMKRLDQIVVGTGTHGLNAHIDVVHAGGDQEGDVRIGPANFGEEFEATDTGHLEIGNYSIESLGSQSRKSLCAVTGGSAVEDRRPQHEGDEL